MLSNLHSETISDPHKWECFAFFQGFGRAEHSISVELLKKKFPDYADITFSNEGY